MSYLVTAKQGGIQIEVYVNGKLSLQTLSTGQKVVVDRPSSQMEKMKTSGLLAIRKATPSEQSKYPKVIVGGV